MGLFDKISPLFQGKEEGTPNLSDIERWLKEVEKVKAPTPITDGVLKELEEKRKAAEDYAGNSLEIGQLMPDGTVYFGKCATDSNGKSLGKIFNMFAAIKDLEDIATYNDTLKKVADPKGLHGHNGTNYATDKEFYAALRDGSYNSGWIIPPINILNGKGADGKMTTPDNLYAHKNKGALKDTFKMTTSGDGSDSPDWYWSSTQSPDDSSDVYSVRFSDGGRHWLLNGYRRFSCRPVRLVAATAAPALG